LAINAPKVGSKTLFSKYLVTLPSGARRGESARPPHRSSPAASGPARLAIRAGRFDPMRFTHLGRTGLTVSRICLGTMNFGPETDEATSFEIMDAALEAGINFFDSANVYGRSKGRGATEEIVGRWFAQGGGRREKVVMATKLYGDMGEWPNEGRLSALNIRRACDASLRRLQTDYIDLYQMHHIDRASSWDEIWEAMEVLRAQGKILYVGSSNFAGWHIAKAQAAATRRNFMGLVSEQSHYNLLTRQIELEVLPAADDYGLGVIPWSPLASGLLGGIVRKKQEGSRRYAPHLEQRVESLRPQLEAYEDLCAEAGEDPGTVGLAWLLTRPAVTGPIVGPRTAEHLDSALRAVDVTLDDKVLTRLDEIFPGHRTAPEDYAW
jgi:NDP-hexose C3-ketoreductase / dTDP-4-oxo-2-deoxy-alpha-D-pentos-2-ene 2,3-reductase